MKHGMECGTDQTSYSHSAQVVVDRGVLEHEVMCAFSIPT